MVSAAIAFAAIGYGLSGCTEKKSLAGDSASADSALADTTPVDTMERIISETPMPKAADELFDDFIFNFAANRKLQMKRIKFPLPVVGNGKVKHLTPKQWKMEHFFMRQDFYTLIFDNQKQMDVVKDTSISHVVVEKIYLNRNHVKQYVFDRINGQWMMVEVANTSLKTSMNNSFLHFYNKFVNDTAFQVASINDPLTFSGPDPDNDFETMTGVLVPEQWPSFAPELPKGMIYNILYGQKYSRSRQKIFVIRGIANGLETELTFRRRNGKWKLMKLTM